ncbi:MAG TPA: phosphoribosylglycinamide formyltransferase [Candidatus Acidoferrum sp.]|nr:phosphoribosylglycinamide formyltransferase [Candidatus Acidoferrum sp.]
MRPRIGVLVSGGGTNLQALIDAGDLGGDIALTVSSAAGAYALERAKAAGIEAVTLPKHRTKQLAYSEALRDLLVEKEIDLVVLAGFLVVLREPMLSAFPERIVNVHPSLIPAFCGDGYYGLKVHEAALARGVKVTGATVHLVNEVTDGGRILLQKAVEVHEGDTPETLQRRVMEEAEWLLLPAAVRMLCAEIVSGRKNPT